MLRVEVGVRQDGQPWVVDFTVRPHHLVTGATQSGKSTLTVALVAGLAPRPAALVGIDAKGGVELGPLAARFSLLATTRTEAAEVLAALVDEVLDRMAVCRAGGVRSIWALPDDTRPAPVVVVVDEVAELFLHADRAGKDEAARCVTALVRLAFTGLRWEEIVAVPVENVDVKAQTIRVDRTASESGGRRDIRDDLKTRAAERVASIPDIAMPAVRRLLDAGATGRASSEGARYGRLVNGDRGGYLGYATWRKYLGLARGYTASHPDGVITYTAHELRHVCASLLIASGASDYQVAAQMGHSRIETTKNIYGHLFAQDRQDILTAMNAAVSRLSVYEEAADAQAA